MVHSSHLSDLGVSSCYFFLWTSLGDEATPSPAGSFWLRPTLLSCSFLHASVLKFVLKFTDRSRDTHSSFCPPYLCGLCDYVVLSFSSGVNSAVQLWYKPFVIVKLWFGEINSLPSVLSSTEFEFYSARWKLSVSKVFYTSAQANLCIRSK